MNAWLALTLVCAAATGCVLRPQQGATVTSADPLCGSPERVVVAEFEGDEDLRRDATDELAAGLEALGFHVLAPRRATLRRTRRNREIVDWVFGGEVRRKATGGVDLKVDLRSLRERRRVWAIRDTRPERGLGDSKDMLASTVQTALEKFAWDVLNCTDSEPR